MKNLSFFLLFICWASSGISQELRQPQGIIPLYEKGAPGSEKWDWEERSILSSSGYPIVQNVVNPVLLYYPAEKSLARGTSMIIAPGGGFMNLMMSYEGVEIANRLNKMGVDAFVLKYRLRYTGKEKKQISGNIPSLASMDGMQAVKILRENADKYHIDPHKIGFMGFSAGGHVTVAVVLGPEESRPDFAAPIYAPAGEKYGLSLKVPEKAPPLFIAIAADDKIVPCSSGIKLFQAWNQEGYPAELHIFQSGGHGFMKKGGGADHYLDRLEDWLKLNSLIEKNELYLNK